jgi:hypothetical protein
MIALSRFAFSNIKLIIFFLLTWQTFQLVAQPLNVTVMIQPPYSNRLEDYLDKGNNVLINVVNTSQAVQQFKLIPSVEGNNGVMAAIRETFLPASPIVLNPGETRRFTFNQLRAFNSNLKQDDLIVQGISFSLLESAGVLPEGAYTLCIKAIQYGGTTLLSGTAGCAGFLITSYDPPMLLVPQQGADIKITKPQLVNFQWTPSGISGKTRYILKIVDMSAVNVFNPNDAFNNPNIATYFEQNNIATNVFAYDLSKPPLVVGRRYAVQILAYDPEGKMSYKNNGRSQAHAFTVSEMGITIGGNDGRGPKEKKIDVAGGFKIKDKEPGGGGNPPVDPNDSPDCMNAGSCQVASPSTVGAKTPAKGELITVGKFKMTVKDIQGNNGTAEIEVPFMQTKVLASFQNLTINNDKQVCGASLIWVNSDAQNLIPEDLLKNTQGVFNDQQLNWQSIEQHIQSQNKKVSVFGINQAPKSLPFKLDLGAGELTILGMVFTPNQAFANIALNAPLPLGAQGQFFSMGAKGVCIRPNGFGISEAEARLVLPSDLTIPLSAGSSFVLNGGANGSFASFDCKGIKKLRLKGSITYSRSHVVPLNAGMEVVPEPAAFSVQFDAEAGGIKEWIAVGTASHPAFTTVQANGFAIGFYQLVLDFSKQKNAENSAFPSNHPMANSPLKSEWTGVIVQKPVLHLPNFLKRSNKQNISVDLSSLVLDHEGAWMLIDVQNVLAKTSDGSLGGWGFSITRLQLDIRKSALQGGALEGGINLPITEVAINYDASFNPGNNQKKLEIAFGISLGSSLDIDMIFAQAQLHNSSTFKVIMEGNKVKPEATLHGSLSIGWDSKSAKKPSDESNSVSSFSLPSLDFQGLKVFNDQTDRPKINLQAMQMSNPNLQAKLANFPIKLKGNPQFLNNDDEVGLRFGLEFTLSKDNSNGIKGETDFTIFAKYDQGLGRFRYDRTQINCIYIDLDIGVAELKGGVCVFKNDPEFGDGFLGSIQAKIQGVGIEVAAALQVGQVQNFDYFFFEAMVRTGVGLPISATMSLYGFGGGFYYNMTRNSLPSMNVNQFNDVQPPQKFSPGYSPSGLKYTPKSGGRGFNAKVVFGLSGGEAAASAVNGDLEFFMEFSKSGGLEVMGMKGGGYGMQNLANRGNAMVTGTFEILINFKQKSFDMGVSLEIDVLNILKGTGSINLHASPNSWFVYIGSWNQNANPANYEPWKDNKRIMVGVDLVIFKPEFNLYFMMGSDMPGLPPLPGILAAKMVNQEGAGINDNRKPTPEFKPNQNMPGFAFGGGMHNETNINALIFYVNVKFFLGFDVSFRKWNVAQCGDIGINGWYAQGQAYAYLSIKAGLQLNLWIWKGQFELLSLECGAVLQAELPNPNYLKADVRISGSVLNGLIKVNTKVKFETGTKVQCQGGSNPFSDLPIVAEISPTPGETLEVYDEIKVAFNYPKGTFEVYNPEEPEKAPKYYYYKIEKVLVKDGNNTLAMVAEPTYSKDGYSAKFLNQGGLYPAEKNLKLELIVYGYQTANKTPVQRDTHKVEFKTGKLPGKFIPQILYTSNPLPGQRFFLFDNHLDGYVRFKDGANYCYLFNNYQVDPNMYDLSKTTYLVQFLETGSGKIKEVLCSCDPSSGVSFYFPDNFFKKETIYRMRVIQRLHFKTYEPPKKNKFEGPAQIKANEEWLTGSKEVEITQGAYKISKYLLPDVEVPKTVDVDFWEIFFQTSRYGTLNEKLSKWKVDQAGHSTVFRSGSKCMPRISKNNKDVFSIDSICDGIFPWHLPLVFLTGDEHFDKYDLYGYVLPDDVDPVIVNPLMTFGTNGHNEHSRIDFYKALRSTVKDQSLFNGIKFPARRTYNNPILNKIEHRIEDALEINAFIETKVVKLWMYGTQHYVGEYTLPVNRTLWQVPGPLTKQEIAKAMEETQKLPEMKNGPFNINIKANVPPVGKNMMAGGMNLKSTNIPVIPIVNMIDYLIMEDYSFAVKKMWYFTSTNQKGSAHYGQEQMRGLVKRPKGNYNLYWYSPALTGKHFNYSWNTTNLDK